MTNVEPDTMTPFDRLDEYLNESMKAKETDSLLHILNDNAAMLTALTTIDTKLELLKTAWATDVPLLIQQMRDAIPPSIVATRKGIE